MNSCFGKLLSRNESNLVNTTYKLVSEFEKSSEKECAKLDKENQKIYSKLLNQAQKAQDAIKNSGLSMNLEVPIPPRPSNRDRYILWKKRNVEKRVIDQTEAILYLQKKGYDYNVHYEAYQAIDLAAEIRRTNQEEEHFEDNSKDFSNVYTSQDKNILRRRSIRALSKNDYYSQNDCDNEYQNQYQNQNQNNIVKQKQKNRVSLYGFDIDVDHSSNSSLVLNNHKQFNEETFADISHNFRNSNEELRNLDRNEQYMIQNRSKLNSNNIMRANTLPSKPSAPPVTTSIFMPSRIKSQEIIYPDTNFDNSNFENLKMPTAPSAPPQCN